MCSVWVLPVNLQVELLLIPKHLPCTAGLVSTCLLLSSLCLLAGRTGQVPAVPKLLVSTFLRLPTFSNPLLPFSPLPASVSSPCLSVCSQLAAQPCFCRAYRSANRSPMAVRDEKGPRSPRDHTSPLGCRKLSCSWLHAVTYGSSYQSPACFAEPAWMDTTRMCSLKWTERVSEAVGLFLNHVLSIPTCCPPYLADKVLWDTGSVVFVVFFPTCVSGTVLEKMTLSGDCCRAPAQVIYCWAASPSPWFKQIIREQTGPRLGSPLCFNTSALFTCCASSG